MAVTNKDIESEIRWYNQELEEILKTFKYWLIELGYEVEKSGEKLLERTEELSGTYTTKQIDLLIDNEMKISFVPYGIWLIGAKGRIDIVGPAGKEKLVYFKAGGPGISVTEGTRLKKDTRVSRHQIFQNIKTDGWYWYDDSTYRRAEEFSKETVVQIMERIT